MTTLRDQAYNLARAYPGGASALALRVGKNPITLNHELLGTGTAKLGLEDAAAITAMSGDLRILQAWAAEECQVLIPMPDHYGSSASTCLSKLSDTAKAFSELVGEVTADVVDGVISDNELGRIERDASDLLAAVHSLLKSARELNFNNKPECVRA